jgi:hypothetical protein
MKWHREWRQQWKLAYTCILVSGPIVEGARYQPQKTDLAPSWISSAGALTPTECLFVIKEC